MRCLAIAALIGVAGLEGIVSVWYCALEIEELGERLCQNMTNAWPVPDELGCVNGHTLLRSHCFDCG